MEKIRQLLLCLVVAFVALVGEGSAATISSCGVNIDTSGVYYLIGDIIDSYASTCITISASDVVLDCQGYRIDGTDNSNSIGISIPTDLVNVTVRNCVITDWEGGIQVGSSAVITGNNISSNYYGIENTGNGATYYNNYLNNTQEDYHETISLTFLVTNTWYSTIDGYNVGNKWEKNTDCTDSDGDNICDSSYIIDSNNEDPYPLVVWPWQPPDNTPPTITFVPPTDPDGATITDRRYTFINVTLSEPGTAWLEWNGTNESMSGSGTNWYINKTNLANGNYTYRVWANDSAGNLNVSETRTIEIAAPADTTPPLWSNPSASPPAPVSYSFSQTYQFNVTWSEPDSAIDTVLIEHNFTGSLVNYTVSSYSGSTYSYTYPSLAAGVYQWRMYANNTEGLVNATDIFYYTVSKASPTLNLTASPGWSVTYGSETNITGMETNLGDEDVTYTLYRNGTPVANPDISTLAAGVYIYVFNTSGGQNYTSGSVSQALEVLKADSSVHLYINGTRSDAVVNQFDTLNFTAVLVVPDSGNVTVTTNYSDGVDKVLVSGSSPLEVIIQMNTSGVFYFNATFEGNENYTSSFENFTVRVNPVDIAPPEIQIHSPANGSVQGDHTPLLNVSISDESTTFIWYSVDDGDNSTPFAGNTLLLNLSFLSNGLHNLTVYANDSWGNLNASAVSFTVNASVIRVPEEVPTIQAGIDYATPAETVYVAPGTYTENVFVNKSINLIGGGNTSTFIVAADPSAHALLISNTSAVNISGFTIRGANASGASGIYLYNTNGSSIQDIKVEQNYLGITLEKSHGNTISSNNITGNQDYGLKVLACFNNLIYSNFIYGSVYDSGTNYWNSSTGGNFYSGYEGWDTDGDGIGEQPYNISGGTNIDYLPLTDRLDNQAPKFENPIASRTYLRTGDTITVTVEVYDAASGVDNSSVFILYENGTVLAQMHNISQSSFMAEITVDYLEGLHTYNFSARDVAGNVNSSQQLTIVVDNTPPTLHRETPRSEEIFNISSILFRLSIEENLSNFSYCDVYINGEKNLRLNFSNLPGNSSNQTYIELSEGVYTWYANCTDSAGNSKSSESWNFTVDLSAPSTSDDAPSEWQRSEFTVNLSCTDNLSGCNYTYYRIDNSSWQEGNQIFIDTEGNHTIEYYSVDRAGNAESIKHSFAALDVTPPRVENISISSEYLTTGASLWVNASIADLLSGVNTSSIKILNENGSPISTMVEVSPGAFGASFSIEYPEGSYTFNVSAKDRVGNENSTQSFTIIVDNTPPSVTVNPTIYPSGKSVAKPGDVITLNITAFDEKVDRVVVNASTIGAGIVLLSENNGFYINDSVVVGNITSGVYYLPVEVYDKAGNSNESEAIEVRVDSQAPYLQGVEPVNNYISTRAEVSFKFEAGDDVDETLAYRLIIDGGAQQYFGTFTNGSQVVKKVQLADGNHTWELVVNDLAQNVISTGVRNLTVITTLIKHHTIPHLAGGENYSTGVVNTLLGSYEVVFKAGNTTTGGNITVNISTSLPESVEENLTLPIFLNFSEDNSTWLSDMEYIILKIYYNQSDIPQDIKEESLRVARFTKEGWIRADCEVLACPAPLGNVTLFDSGVDTSSHYVWARVSGLSLWGVMGKQSNTGSSYEVSDGDGMSHRITILEVALPTKTIYPGDSVPIRVKLSSNYAEPGVEVYLENLPHGWSSPSFRGYILPGISEHLITLTIPTSATANKSYELVLVVKSWFDVERKPLNVFVSKYLEKAFKETTFNESEFAVAEMVDKTRQKGKGRIIMKKENIAHEDLEAGNKKYLCGPNFILLLAVILLYINRRFVKIFG
jgi:parallel beta-helix repeat protein